MSFELNRQQLQAATTLKGDVLVTAAAGSGKTRMLTQRLINATQTGDGEGQQSVSLAQIAAVTFTEKAAGELVERVRRALIDEGKRAEVREIDGAWISTIHGLCNRIARRHALRLGIDPRFVVGDTVLEGSIQRESFEQASCSCLRQNEDAIALFDEFGFAPLFSAVSMVAQRMQVEGREVPDLRLESAQGADELECRVRQLLEDGITACSSYDGRAAGVGAYAQSCERSLGLIDGAGIDAGEGRARLLVLGEALGDVKLFRSNTKGMEHVHAASAEALNSIREAIVTALVEPHAQAFVGLVEEFRLRFQSAKRAQSVLDFDDLQVLAVTLLESDEMLRTHYRDVFEFVMVDEFQDTDRLQLRLIEALANDNLCTVGDEHQAIYRFRGADLDVYRRHRESMIASGAADIELPVNYRSHSEILAFINDVFGRPEYFGDSMLRLEPPDPPRPAGLLAGQARAEVYFVDRGDASSVQARDAEASMLAARIGELVACGIEPGDVAVLVQRYRYAHVYAEAISRTGVPVAIVGGSRFFDLPEVAVARVLLQTIANPEDDHAVAGLLASPVGVSDTAMLRVRTHARSEGDSFWEALTSLGPELDDDDRERVSRLIEAVDGGAEHVGTEPLSDTLFRAVECCGLDLVLLSDEQRGRDAFANVLKLGAQADEYARLGRTGVGAFLDWLADKERFGSVEAPVSVAAGSSGAVRIMSVHASKGLEFPVVVVPDLGSTGKGRSGIVRVDSGEDGLRVALKAPPSVKTILGTTAPSWFRRIGEQESLADEEESARVLYVAFTRAQDLLIVGGVTRFKTKNPSSTHDHLLRLERIVGLDRSDIAESDSVACTGAASKVRVRVCATGESYRDPAPATNVMESSLPERGRELEDCRLDSGCARRLSFSQLAVFAECERRFYIEQVLGLRPSRLVLGFDDGAIRFGSAVHAVLQVAIESTVPPSARRVSAIGRYYGLEEEHRARMHAVLQAFLVSPLYRRVRDAERLQAEAPFYIPLDDRGTILTGSLDLYARFEDGSLVVDYKTGSAGTLDDWHEGRRMLQAQCYALAAAHDSPGLVTVVFARLADHKSPTQIEYTFDAEGIVGARLRIEALKQQIAEHDWKTFSRPSGDVCRRCPHRALSCTQ